MPQKIDLFSLSLVTKFKSALFPQTLRSGAHTICWGTFPLALQPKVRAPLLSACIAQNMKTALWTQTNFNLGLLSLSLVSQILVGFACVRLAVPTFL